MNRHIKERVSLMGPEPHCVPAKGAIGAEIHGSECIKARQYMFNPNSPGLLPKSGNLLCPRDWAFGRLGINWLLSDD